MSEPDRHAPLTSLIASARRLTSQPLRRSVGSSAKSWQEDAWEMYDLVGEQRFLASTLAGRLSQARLFVGSVNEEDPTGMPVPVMDNPDVTDILAAVGNSSAARAQILWRMGVNLFVAGDGWLVGIPRHLLPDAVTPQTTPHLDPDLDIADLDWRMLSVSEVTSAPGGLVTLKLGEGDDERVTGEPEDLWLIRVWRPHPRRWWEADSPTRSSLPVLRELVGLTMHISAQVDSRLAGAGLLIVPQSAARAIRLASGATEDSSDDPFTEALLEAMLKPIQDRSSASALVPLVIVVPDEAAALFQFMTFAKPLDSEARSLRDEAIRRLALGQDAPPELLLGTAGMNHWGAWLVQEDVVTTHLEPPLALICDALTTQYLWPVLIDQGMSEEEAHTYVIWYDVSDLIVRPNRSTDAIAVYDRGGISTDALRDATGFDDSDAPPATEELPAGVRMALDMVIKAPSLAQDPGLPALVAQVQAVMGMSAGEQGDAPTPVVPTEAEQNEERGGERTPTGAPGTDQNPVTPPSIVTGGGLRAEVGKAHPDVDQELSTAIANGLVRVL